VVKKPSYEELEQRVKELEAALGDSEFERTTILDLQPYHSVIQSLDNRIIWANRAAFESVDVSREDLIDRYCYEIWPQQTYPCPDCPVIKSVQTGKPQSIEKTTPDGRKWHIRGYPIRNNRGEITRALEVTEEITERKQAEEALRESEEQYRKIFKNIQDVYYEVTFDGIIIEASPSIEDVSLYKREEIIGKSLSDIYVDPKNRDEFLKELLKNGKVTDYEALLTDKDGSQVHCSITAKLIRDKHGHPVKIIGSLRDITERKRMEESLRQSESQKRAILDASIDRIRYIDKDMKIIWANKTTAMELDMTSEDLVGHTCYKLFVGRDTPCEGCPTVRARETGKNEHAVMYQPEVEGIEGESYWDTYCVPLKNDAGEIESFIQISRNITGQKRAEEQIHTLTQELMRAQESERQMISRELHDCVAQDLSSIKIGFETLFDHQPTIPPEISQKVSEMSKTLRECIKEVRDLSYDLRPPVLDELGLVQALFQYCHDFSEDNGINVDFHSAGMKDLRLDFDTEINLYRLIQEGLANIKKHADADHVTIRLVAAFPNIILRIEDNGKGFDVQKRLATLSEEKRMGIRSMEQRVKLLQGEMEIQSKPMQGTKISITLPYKNNKGDS
jgi:PAS domain S-box-containing protein